MGRADHSATGIPVTAVYFAPDHTDSSQYVQYFGMIEGASWLGRSGAEPNADRADELFAEALAASGDEKTDAVQRSSARR